MTPKEIIKEAVVAANAAGDEWMARAVPKYTVRDSSGQLQGTMLDLCGNAHLQFLDKRSKIYKLFVKERLVRGTGNGVVELDHKYRGHQEHGLHLACIKAAKAVFLKHGITNVQIWNYID